VIVRIVLWEQKHHVLQGENSTSLCTLDVRQIQKKDSEEEEAIRNEEYLRF
jgi:hypothetical protein